MPSFVIAEKCDGCKGGDKTACMYICPNDLMVLDPDKMKAYNQEPQFVNETDAPCHGRHARKARIEVFFRNGTIKRFKFPIRTTPEGTANEYPDLRGDDLESGLLATEEADGLEIPRPKELA